MKEIKSAFEDLKVYQKTLDFVDIAYELSSRFPPQENYALASQLNRAAVSIALNISEGSGNTNAQFNRFLQIAMNSVKECVVCATITKRRQYLTVEENHMVRSKLEELSKMITGLKKYLKNKKK